MPKCPRCDKEVYFAERKTSMGKDWHAACLKCAKCSKTLTPGSHAEHNGEPYCNKPCYAALFGPGAHSFLSLDDESKNALKSYEIHKFANQLTKCYGHGGTESHVFK